MLEPIRETPPRDLGSWSIVRSWLLMRSVIGAIGLALPVVLIVGDVVVLDGGVSARGSLSAYYHSGMRDVFVAALVAAGFFLVTYKVFESNLDNALSALAGTAAIVVALFPTEVPAGISVDPTPLQRRLGEGTTSTIHYVAAVVFIVSLGVLSYYFGYREGRRSTAGRHTMRTPHFWRLYHWTCTAVIGAAVLFIAVTKLFGVYDSQSLLIGETVAVIAFGSSWLAKGLELDVLAA